MMQFHTLSVIAGSEACNARCDFCISGMTPSNGVEAKYKQPNCTNLDTACRLAEKGGVTTALITGKGEPTLFPADISGYLYVLPKYFPIIELQTNAMTRIFDQSDDSTLYLNDWRKAGLTTIIISIVHYDAERNREIYCHQDGEYRFDYPDLPKTIEYLHNLNFSVRLGCVGCKGYIDNPEEIKNLIDFAKNNKVEQLTWRPVTRPEDPKSDTIGRNTDRLAIDAEDSKRIATWVQMNGHRLLKLPHGAVVYDVFGQNICLSNCLTHDANEPIIRQLIYFPDGHLRYSWEYEGSIIL